MITSPILRSEMRPDATWIWIDCGDWMSVAQQLYDAGFTRCEWLKGVHLSGEQFEILLSVTKPDLSESYVVGTKIDQSIASIAGIYPSTDFHERECAQLLGVMFSNRLNDDPAFETTFDGFPLRRDFVLTERLVTPWPGQVDPEKAARRRPTPPPGVNQEWNL